MREWPIMSVTKIQNLIYASLPNTGNGMEHLWCFASWSLGIAIKISKNTYWFKVLTLILCYN